MIKNFFLGIYELSSLKTLEIQFYLCAMYFNGIDLSINLFSEKKYFQFYLDLYILKLDLDITRRCHHHGMTFNLSIFNVNFDFNLYDIRHWNDELNNYESIS